MKKLFLFGAALMMSGIAMAQYEQMHVFRNDKDFNTFKASEVENIKYTGGTDGFTKIVVKDNSGKTTTLDMSAVDSVVMHTTGLPEIHVNLIDYPDWTDLKKDATHTKSTVYAANLYMDGCGMYDDLPLQTVEFRGRGNSTWNMPKTPYRFKMAKKTSVCGMKKAKTFALIANYIDCTLMRNAVALWLANYLEMPYSNHSVPVKVYFNDHYKGQYMMTEKIGIGGGSVDIDENTGMLFELDSNYDEDFKYKFSWTKNNGGWPESYSIPVMVKDPDLTEIVGALGTTEAEYWAKWQDDFTKFAKAIVQRDANESLEDVLDIESAVNFFIVNGLANNHELQHPKSLYIHKENLEGVYKFGPVWDFDWAFTYDGSSYDGEQASATKALLTGNGDYSGYSFLKCLFANEGFRKLFKEKWDAFVKDGYPKLKAYMEEYADMIEPSAKENGLLWPDDTSVSWRRSISSWNFRSNFAKLKTWIENRVNYMSGHKNYGLYE